MSSFKAYGKVNAIDQEMLEARRRTRKRIIIITLSSIVLVAIILGAVLGTTLGKSDSKPKNVGGQQVASAIKAVCNLALYPESCYASLSSQISNSSRLNPESISKLSINIALKELLRASKSFSKDLLKGVTGNISLAALENCQELLGLAVDYLDTAFISGKVVGADVVDDIKTWLSAAGTYQQTCLDGFGNLTESQQSSIFEHLKNSTEFTSNSLAIITGVSKIADSLKLRRLLSTNEFPSWLSPNKRRLLQSSSTRPKPDAIVAQDGSGQYTTIKAALLAVPDKSTKRFVIYVKKGEYKENVRVEKSKWNVMMYGDGMSATIVHGWLNVIDGTPTFQSATFAVFGRGFIGMDMGFRNSAGPTKHQAVAFMASSDQAVLYRCRMDAYQDTLYVHALRQFYRECDILGTVDFIFGNAAAILQNCNILPRLPMKGQQNTITAQGRIDPNQNTGIVIQNCNISAYGDLLGVRTYLGRPWKNYSRTIIMQSAMANLINPAGWLPWIGTTAPDTIFYSEFQNYGAGSSTTNRVKWKGVKNLGTDGANKFTVQSFIFGHQWISGTGVPYKSGL